MLSIWRPWWFICIHENIVSSFENIQVKTKCPAWVTRHAYTLAGCARRWVGNFFSSPLLNWVAYIRCPPHMSSAACPRGYSKPSTSLRCPQIMLDASAHSASISSSCTINLINRQASWGFLCICCDGAVRNVGAHAVDSYFIMRYIYRQCLTDSALLSFNYKQSVYVDWQEVCGGDILLRVFIFHSGKVYQFWAFWTLNN